VTVPDRSTAPAFKPAWWCRSGHLQTLWPFLFRRIPRPRYRRERIELPDGDFLDLDWNPVATPAPVVVILHGLEGNSQSAYARGLVAVLTARGLRACVMHFRGTSGDPNRLARSYHSGDTADFDFVLSTLQGREPCARFAAAGFSLGGNVLLKWLGERGADAPLAAAAAASVPFELAPSAARLEQGLSRIYGEFLLRRLKRSARRKLDKLPISAAQLLALRTIREFDEFVTAPLHGFRGATDYYARSSCRPYLRAISVRTLIVQAADDPFMSPDVIPRTDELSPAIEIDLSPHGGHVGFVSGRWPWQARYWLEKRVVEFIASRL
jgi:predicted alpha/beta-fold hydrolase